MDRKKIIVIGLFGATALVSFYLGRISQRLSLDQAPAVSTMASPVPIMDTPTPSAVPTADQVPTLSVTTPRAECVPDPLPVDGSWKESVKFSPAKEIFQAVTSKAEVAGEIRQYSIRFFDFGAITGGPHQGSRLVISHFSHSHELKNCEIDCGPKGLEFQRFLLKGKKLVLLAALSDPIYSYGEGFFNQSITQLGLELSRDDEFSIPVLKPLRGISVNGGCLSFSSSRVATPYKSKRKWGVHELYGEIVGDGVYFEAWIPDGTVRQYYSLPPAGLEIPGGNDSDRYACSDEPGKREESKLEELVSFDTAITESALLEFKTLAGVGQIHTLKAKENVRVKQEYDDYARDYRKYLEYQAGEGVTSTEKVLSFEEYWKRVPVIYWKDPLGRWVRCRNTALRSPLMAEPLVYLYPEKVQRVRVEIDSRVRVTQSIPALRNGVWDVRAEPLGRLQLASDSRFYRYLFWEGRSAFLPIPDQGYSVAREQIPAFLTERLSALGLNEAESTDFKRYWIPRLKAHAYYLLTFYDETTLRELAPLKITPEPVTLIRVMMDVVPLAGPIEIAPPKLRVPKPRDGFTVVEWGGLVR